MNQPISFAMMADINYLEVITEGDDWVVTAYPQRVTGRGKTHLAAISNMVGKKLLASGESVQPTDTNEERFRSNPAALSALLRLVELRGVTGRALLRTAYNLLGDGSGSGWNDNPEYSRGIFDLLADSLGLPGDENRADLIALIRATGTMS